MNEYKCISYIIIRSLFFQNIINNLKINKMFKKFVKATVIAVSAVALWKNRDRVADYAGKGCSKISDLAGKGASKCAEYASKNRKEA